MYCVKIAHVTQHQTIFMLPLQLLYIANPNVFLKENSYKEPWDANAQQLRNVYDLRKKKQYNFPKLYFVEKINHFNNFKEDKSCTKQVQPVIAFRNITGAITRQYMIEKWRTKHISCEYPWHAQ